MTDVGRVLGLDLTHARLDEGELDDEVQQLIDERERARASRNFARADQIRDELQARGIVLEDSPQGTRWRRG